MLIGGGSIVLYLLRAAWENMYSILREYNYYVFGYLALSSIVSFAFCYRLGPVTNERTINLLQWSVQVLVTKIFQSEYFYFLFFSLFCKFFSLLMVEESSEHKEAAMATIVIIIIVHNFPKSFTGHLSTIW